MSTRATTMDAVYTETDETHDPVDIQAFGFWIYLMTDLILFAALFATFAVIGRNYAGGPTGRELFDLPYLFGETLFLLFSTACYGLTMLAVHEQKKNFVLAGLAVTFLLGLGFVSMESHEFYGMIAEGNGPDRSGFLSAFFTLVGTHGTHVTVGLIWMAAMIGQVAVKGFTRPVESRLMRLGMFWHFLDIVWIGIFTFVYMTGVV